MMHMSIERHLKNFVGCINLLGSEPAPRLRAYYAAVTSFNLSFLYSKSYVPHHFEYGIKNVLDQMQAYRDIYGAGFQYFRDMNYMSVSIKVSPLFMNSEVLNIYSTYKTLGEREAEWQSIKELYKDLLQ